MTYIQETLLPGERVICKANIHWIVYVWGFIFLGLAICLYAATRNNLTLVLFPLALIILVKTYVEKNALEFVITNRRVVAKSGWIARSSMELELNRVGSIEIDQTSWGRMLGYGTVRISGLGAGFEYLNNIEAPIHFRNMAMQAIEASRS